MANPDPYPLTRGAQQLTRVNLLQYLWRDTNGYLIHPAAQGASLKVADVATATGLWLCEVERESPGAHELHGFDISADSFIRKEHLPKAIQLHVVDASGPPPDEFRGQFDVVHVRLLQAVIMDDDPGWVVSHCMQMLKPGGYLQWEEFDPMAVAIHEGSGKAENLHKLTNMLQTRAPGGWVEKLPQHMEKQGLEVVGTERKRELSFHHTVVTYLFCLVFEEYATTYLDIKGPPGSGDDMRKLAQDSFAECLAGSHAEYMFQTVVARKSS